MGNIYWRQLGQRMNKRCSSSASNYTVDLRFGFSAQLCTSVQLEGLCECDLINAGRPTNAF